MLPIAGIRRIATAAILFWLGSYHTLYAAEFSITPPPYPQGILQPPTLSYTPLRHSRSEVLKVPSSHLHISHLLARFNLLSDTSGSEQPLGWAGVDLSIHRHSIAGFSTARLALRMPDMTPSTYLMQVQPEPVPGYELVYFTKTVMGFTDQPIIQPPLQFEFTAEAYCSCIADELIVLNGFAQLQTAQDRLHLVMAEHQPQPDQLGHQIEIFAEVKAGAESGIVFLDNSKARFQHRDKTNQFFNGNLILGRVYDAPFDRIEAIFSGSNVTSGTYEVLGVEIIQH